MMKRGINRAGVKRDIQRYCLPSSKTDQDWTIDHAAGAGLPEIPTKEERKQRIENLPENVDLRADLRNRLRAELSRTLQKDFWPIEKQEENYACVGHAVASLLKYHFVKADRLDPNKNISARYIWMAAKETDEFTDRPTAFIEKAPTSLKAALHVAQKYGVVTEDIMPGGRYSEDTKTFYATAARLRIDSYFNLFSLVDNEIDFDIWKLWLHTQGPIAIAINPDDNFMSILCEANKAKQRNLKQYGTFEPGCSHAVLIVGYENKGKQFILRNSFGTDWGDNGYSLLSKDYLSEAMDLDVMNQGEAYGVFVPPWKEADYVNTLNILMKKDVRVEQVV